MLRRDGGEGVTEDALIESRGFPLLGNMITWIMT